MHNSFTEVRWMTDKWRLLWAAIHAVIVLYSISLHDGINNSDSMVSGQKVGLTVSTYKSSKNHPTNVFALKGVSSTICTHSDFDFMPICRPIRLKTRKGCTTLAQRDTMPAFTSGSPHTSCNSCNPSQENLFEI